MRIGLLTYHKSYNCGAVMQTYATCRILKELGHEVELIDLRQPEPIKFRQLIFIPRFIKFFFFFKKYYPHISKRYRNLKELKEAKLNYDCLIVGSDQTWNPLISKEHCLAYFLDFGDKSIKRISYASSFGVSVWPNTHKDLIKKIIDLLHNFSAISVREETGKNIIKKEFGLDSKLVLDPTMLHSSYDEITTNIKPNNRIICYLLKRSKEQLNMSLYLSKITGYKARMIFNGYPLKGFEYCYPPAVKGWIEQIAGASIVVTDSFHGLVFSLLYHRQFAVIPNNNGLSSRLLDLLKLVGLENHVFRSLDDLVNNIEVLENPIDYDKVDSIISFHRKDSINYLINALKK